MLYRYCCPFDSIPKIYKISLECYSKKALEIHDKLMIEKTLTFMNQMRNKSKFINALKYYAFINEKEEYEFYKDFRIWLCKHRFVGEDFF